MSDATGTGNPQPPGPGWWLASDGNWYPPESATAAAAALAPKAGPYLLTIGDIGVTSDTIVTPNGTAPLAGSQWIATDMTRTESKIPTWAIVMAIVFAIFCLLGLFFLLVKERVTTGYVDVGVRSGDLYHRTQIPVSNEYQVSQTRALVAQAQSLAAQAR